MKSPSAAAFAGPGRRHFGDYYRSVVANFNRGFASAAAQPATEPISIPNATSTHDGIPRTAPLSPRTPNAACKSHTLRVEASYVGSRINVYDLLARPEFSSHYKRLHKGTAILALTDTPVPEVSEADGMPLGPYLVATSYGSAVFFDVDAAAKDRWLAVLTEVAVDPVVGDRRYNEGTNETTQTQ